MHTIHLKHPRKSKPVELTVPGCWNELTNKQLIQAAKVLGSTLPRDEMRMRLLMVLVNVPWYSLRAYWLWFKLDEDALPDLLSLTDFLFDTNDLTDWKIKWVKPFGAPTYYGPFNRLSNITLHEFSYADTAFNAYLETEDMHQLNKLIAVLYRPAIDHSANDVREPFDQYKLEKRARKIARLSWPVRLAILYNWIGCRSMITDMFPKIFSQKDGKASKFGWADVIVSTAGQKFGTVDQTADANLFNILIHHKQQIEEQEELQKQQKKK
jgi:hypothetical protein